MIDRVGPGEADAAASALRRDGVVVIENVVSPARIAALRSALEAEYPAYLGRAPLPPDRHQVGEGRFNAPVAFAGNFAIADIVFAPVLAAVCADLLGKDWQIEAYGAVFALPGAADQKLHRDGAFLYPETQLDRILPPYALTFACPLMRVDAANGRTLFIPASHRVTGEADSPPHAPDIEAGSLVLWDFRIAHLGQANPGPAARAMLYATLCRPFWADFDNFDPALNTKLVACRKALDALEPAQRKRFCRAVVSD